MNAGPGISGATTAAALMAVAIMAGASLYFAESYTRAGSQAVPASGNASFSAASSTTSSAAPSSITSGPDHQLIGEFDPPVPIVTQNTSLNCTLYFSTVGTVPSPLNISLSSPNGISLTVYPDQIVEPGIAIYVNTTVTMRAPPGLAPGTYPVTVTATGGGATYTETLQVEVAG